jgi:hypothetical protein
MKKVFVKALPFVIIIGLVAVLVVSMGGVTWVQTNFGGLFKPADISGLKSNTIGTCDQDPLITISPVDELNRGTALTPVYTMKLNGGNTQTLASGSTKFTKGDKVSFYANDTGYVSEIIYTESNPYIVDCGQNPISIDLLALTSVPTMKVKGDNGLQLTKLATAGTNNDTGATSTITQSLTLSPSLYAGFDDAIVVVEYNDSNKIDKITSSTPLYNNGATPKNWKTFAPAGKSVYGVFRVSGHHTSSAVLEWQVVPKSGQSSSQTLANVTVYFAQDYKNFDGSFAEQIIEQSDGTEVWNNMTSYAFGVN